MGGLGGGGNCAAGFNATPTYAADQMLIMYPLRLRGYKIPPRRPMLFLLKSLSTICKIVHVRNTYAVFSCAFNFSSDLIKNVQRTHIRYLSSSKLMANVFCLIIRIIIIFKKLAPAPHSCYRILFHQQKYHSYNKCAALVNLYRAMFMLVLSLHP